MTTRLTRSRGTWVSLSHSAFHRAQGQSLLLLLSSQRPGSPSLFLLLMLLASAATKAVFILLHPVQQSLPYFIPAVFFRACCPLPKSVRASVEALGLPMCRWAVKTLLCFLRTDSAHRHGPAHTTGGCPFRALRDAELSVKSIFFPRYILSWSHSRIASIREIKYQMSAIQPQSFLSVRQRGSVQRFGPFVPRCLVGLSRSSGEQRPAHVCALRALVFPGPSGATPSLLLTKNRHGTWAESRKVIIT